jgi:hypothetical protein
MKIKINKFEFNANNLDQALAIASLVLKDMFEKEKESKKTELIKKEALRDSLTADQVSKVKKAFADKKLTGKFYPLLKLALYHRNNGSFDDPSQWKCGQALIELVNQL